MKTIFTLKSYRFGAVIYFMAFLSVNLFAQTSHPVTVSYPKFDPADLTITAGDEVVWTNVSGSHNVNGDKSVYPSNPVSFGNAVGTGWTYKFTFNTPGTYDYQCDPHVSLGMVGKITVLPKSEPASYKLTVNFTGMTPHVGETLWLAVIDQATKMEIGRVKTTVSANFVLEVPGIKAGKSYYVDFYADHNKNGMYDKPSGDHAWRIPVNNVTGDTSVDFAHNTNFTDIAWKNKLTMHFTGMTPHLNETLTLYLKETSTGIYKDTVVISPVTEPVFDIMSWEIKPGGSYHIDFYADHNKNGTYDPPATDHVWRIDLNNVLGDTIVNFAHNTNFTDIFNVTLVPNFADASGKIQLFPNPANDFIDIRIPQSFASVRSIKVYSITGSLVVSNLNPVQSGIIHYDLRRFKSGVYFLEILTGTRKDVMKFIRQ